jgi:radical SAM protein with 4Fe4S-binding SPASM domain
MHPLAARLRSVRKVGDLMEGESRLLRLRRKAFEQCIPLNVTFEITLRCNLRCAHCYNFDRGLSYKPERTFEEELSSREIHRILDEVRDEGCLFLAFTGGEALVHSELNEFIRHASGAGMAVTVKSNGTRLPGDTVDRLRQSGTSAVEISLYGAKAETHDSFVGLAGAFRNTIDGARRVREAGLRVKFSFVIVRRNADEIAAVREMAAAMGIPCAIDPQITARYDGSRSSLNERVDRETLDRLYRGPLQDLVPEPGDGASVQCSCARSVCGITAFGEVYPCIGAPLPCGTLKERSFKDIWWNSETLRGIRSLTLADFPACSSCDLRRSCRRSSGVVYSNTGDYTGPSAFGDDWTCMEAEVLHSIQSEKPKTDDREHLSGASLRRHSFES